ncbi:HEPN domain-containing protein [Pararhodobacter aggregans]
MLPEVGRIIEAHVMLRKGCRGPDPHKSILRGSVLMLCAAWEVYCESVLVEAVDKILQKKIDPLELPKDMQGQLRAAVHDQDVFKSQPLKLAGFGWRTVYKDEVASACSRFNTPKSDRLNDLFKKWLGIKEIAKSWSYGAKEIDRFVSLRGEIAHRGGDSESVTREEAIHFKAIVAKSIQETDNAIYEYLKDPALLAAAPWQRTSKE